MKALLWDVNISEEEFMVILRDKFHPEHRWALIRLFTLCPTNKLFNYITRDNFLSIWPEIRDDVEKDFWGRARVEKFEWLYRFMLREKVRVP